MAPRRDFITTAGTAIVGLFSQSVGPFGAATEGGTMYGRIAKMTAVAGQRDALAAILLGSTRAMPGCLSYVVATDPAESDTLWITEVWDSAASHRASLSIPEVQVAIAKARQLIAAVCARTALTMMFLLTAVSHFAPMKKDLIAMVPPSLPRPELLVFVTGLAEALGAIGLLIPATRFWAACGLIVLLLVMLPANISAARRELLLRGRPAMPLWLRIPTQVIHLVGVDGAMMRAFECAPSQ